MTKFFEVASVSAPHIYHSALELSPPSSIVRKLYHHQRITSSVGPAIGTPSSWSQSVPIPDKDSPYRSCAWSPCGRFIAAQTHEAVEVRDPLTSELLSSLQSTERTPRLTGPLAYSSDGRSLCCASNTGIIIWDIQTGGMVREVGCDDTLDNSSSLMWSSDGRTIGAVLRRCDTWAVVTYDVASGRILSRDTLKSADEPYIWAHDKSFLVMVTSLGREVKACTIDIFEVGPTLIQVRSFPISMERWPGPWWSFHVKSFSPISHHVSISVTAGGGRLLVLDARNPVGYLLNENQSSDIHCFSSDGKLFAASLRGGVHVWKYSHDPNPGYTPWRTLLDQGQSPDNTTLLFSPTSSSILGHLGGILQVWYPDNRFPACVTNSEPYIIIPPHATYTVTAHLRGSTVIITDHTSPQTPPRFIYTGITILGFALTGNVLLVVGSDTIVAWRITERGAVDSVVDDRVAGPSDSIWTVSPQRRSPQSRWSPTTSQCGFILPEFHGIAQAGSLTPDETLVSIYQSGAGEGSEPAPEPSQPLGHWYNLKVTSRGQFYLRCHELSQLDDLSEEDRKTPRTAFREGWVKDLAGKHRLWIPAEWRMAEGCMKLFYYFAILQPELPGDLNVAMF